MTDKCSSKIAKLNNLNYQTWKFKVELLLIKEDLWDVVAKEVPDPVTATWQTKDGKARATIGLLVEDNQLHLIRKQTTAKGSWQTLQKYHEKATLSSKVNLLRKLCALKLTEHGDMENHLAEMENLIDQLTSLGEQLAEHLSVAFFLSSLPESYGTLITALETRPEEDLTIELVKSKLLEESKRRYNSSSTHVEQQLKALKVIKKEVKPKVSLTCFFCKKPNHIKKECRKYIEWKRRNPDHTVKTLMENVAEERQGENSTLDSCFQTCNTENSLSWHIDSGATAHMCSNKSLFNKIDKQHKGEVLLANGQKIQTTGIGDILLQCTNPSGKEHLAKLCDVLYVPQLKGNLISVNKLVNKGLEVHFKGKQCNIIKDGKTVASAEENKGLFQMKTLESVQKVTQVYKAECIHVWHNRMGHRDPQAIKNLEKQDRASGINIKSCQYSKVCECCIETKMIRKSFPKKSDSKTTEVLDLVHTDVCGPMQTTTPGGKRYFLTMIDDYSKYTEVYLLAHKSEVPEKIKEYVRSVQTKFRRTPKKLRSDRGGEYTSERLQTFLRDEGIRTELSNPYTPQQNGCAERKNRYLTEMTRCMLKDSGLPQKYWGEAVITANHLQNRLPVEGRELTPYETWNKRKPDLSYIKRFGSTAYVAVPKEKRQKLDDKATKLTFVGYENGTKGYRLLDVTTDKIQISRDVIFSEGDPHPSKEIWCEVELSEKHPTRSEHENMTESHTDTEVTDSNQEVNPTEANVRRSERRNKGKPPERLIEEINKVTTDESEPKSYKEATSKRHEEQWCKAMDDEMKSLKENGTWILTELPKNKTAIGSKWVYKLKKDEEGNVTRHKARLVAQGYSQKYGDDYDEVFAPVAKPTTLRTILTIAGLKGMTVKHYDIETAYLNGDLSHEVYMKQPEGYHEGGTEVVCRLKKNLYGLKQGANEWNKKLNDILVKNQYKRSDNDPCLYSKQNKGEWIYISIHVDDLIVATTNESMLSQFEEEMSKKLIMKNLGNLKYYLGIHFERDDQGIFLLHQKNYIESKLEKFNLTDSKPSHIPVDPGYQKRTEVQVEAKNKDIYRSAIGALNYLATNSRPDISVGTSILSRHVNDPKESDWVEVKRIYRYLKYTIDKKLKLGNMDVTKEQLIGYVDADWSGDTQDRKSNTGYVFKYFDAPISWASRKQAMVTLSSTEAEYIALTEATQEGLWLRRLLTDLNQNLTGPTVLFEDNQSCIKLLQNERASHRTKHIATKHHFVRELCKSKELDVQYCPSENMMADLLTKPLEAVKTRKFTQAFGLN